MGGHARTRCHDGILLPFRARCNKVCPIDIGIITKFMMMIMLTTATTMTTMTITLLRLRSVPPARMSLTATGTSDPLLTPSPLADSSRGEHSYFPPDSTNLFHFWGPKFIVLRQGCARERECDGGVFCALVPGLCHLPPPP